MRGFWEVIHKTAWKRQVINPVKPTLWDNDNYLRIESLDNAVLELGLAEASWYVSHYTMLSNYGNCRRLLNIKNKLKIGCFYRRFEVIEEGGSTSPAPPVAVIKQKKKEQKERPEYG